MLSLRLASKNIKKKKESCIILAAFLLLATLFMNLGFSVFTQMRQIFFKKTELLSSPHLTIPCSSNTYQSEFEEFVFNDTRVSLAEKEEVIYMSTSKNDRNALELGAFIYNADASRSIAPFSLLEEDKTIPKEDAIYVPIQLKNENVTLGEPYTLTYKGSEYHFIVAGYFESTYYCNTNSGFYKYYISKESYERLHSEIGRATILSIRFSGNEANISRDSDEFREDFLADTDYTKNLDNLLLSASTYEDMKETSTDMISAVAALLCMFSFIIFFIAIAMIITHVKETISENIISFGVLESIGYTTKQIMASIFLEFVIISVIGSFLGTLCSYLCMPIFKTVLNGMCGFDWMIMPHILVDGATIAIVLLLIGTTALLTSYKIRHLSPVNALKKQLKNTDYKINRFFLLQNGKGSLNLRLALKNIILQRRNNFVYALIVTIGIFAIGITLTMFLNFAFNHNTLTEVVGYELSDLQVTISDGCDINDLSDELTSYDDVRKVLPSSVVRMKQDNTQISAIVFHDFNQLEVIKPYKGSFPKYDNETVLSYTLSKRLKKNIGDTIPLTLNGCEQLYYITGLYSSMNGDMVLLSEDGMKRLNPAFHMNTLHVYLNNPDTANEVRKMLETDYKVSVDFSSSSVAEQKIAKLLADYGITSAALSVYQDGEEILSLDSSAFKIKEIENMKAFADGQINSYANIMRLIVTAIFLLTLFIVAGILRITIKSNIRRNRRDYGIYKSMGYTTKDIVKQLSLSYLLPTICGCVTGIILTLLTASSIFNMFFEVSGAAQITCVIHPMPLILCGVIFSTLLYGSAIITSYQVKDITAYELLTE